MLNGIGGATIAEAKANMSAAEAMQWQLYREARGSLNMGWVIDRSLAQLKLYQLRGLGDTKTKMDDLFPLTKPFGSTSGEVIAGKKQKATAKEIAAFLQAGAR